MKYGDRNPSLFLMKNKTIHFTSSINGVPNYWINSKTKLEAHNWYSINVSQKLLNGKYWFECYIDGDLVQRVENEQPKKFSGVKVYTGRGPPQVIGKLRNLLILTKIDDENETLEDARINENSKDI